MCGIFGYAGTERPGVLERMAANVAHRGPDGSGYWHDRVDGVHVGHVRLAIVDRAGGVQPMRTTSGDLVVVFNGELYNAAELRAELEARGHRFISDYSDTEVLLHGYREWGNDLLTRLEGMWAFVIYDRTRGRLFGSRDRFGEKPLYYALVDETLLFGSELGALRAHPACPTETNRLAVQKYFAYGFVPAPLTFLKNAHVLPSGCAFTFDLKTKAISVWKYWEFVLEPNPELVERPDDDLADELLALLRQAVRRRLAAPGRLGIFLSGGIDSSAVAALAVAESGTEKMESFNIGFLESTFDESTQARTVAARLGIVHRERIVDPDTAERIFVRLGASLDEPMGDPSLLPTFALAELARNHIRVALGGDGGDELFAGYDTFRALRFAEVYSARVPMSVHRALVYLSQRLPVGHGNLSFDFRVKRFLRAMGRPPALWNPSWLAPLAQPELEALFREPVDLEEVYAEAIAAWNAAPDGSVVDRSLQFFTRVYLPDNILRKTDRASMLHGVELRSPFLDRDVVDFARRLPTKLKLRGGCTKYLLKRALRRILASETIHRPKKGFGLPIGAWIKAGRFQSHYGRPPPGIDRDFLVAAHREHFRGVQDHRQLLWCAGLWSLWQGR